MTDIDKHLEDITEMRKLMDKSTRFVSLSGLSGVAAGLFALIGAALALTESNMLLDGRFPSFYPNERWIFGMTGKSFVQLTTIATGVLIAALLSAYFLTWRKVRKNKESMWTPASKRMMTSLLIPLVTGGVFCLLLLYHGAYGLVAPATLIFYGLGCISAAQYTRSEIKYIGLINVGLGLLNCLFIGYGILFWTVGFGFLHIFYGLVMYYRYDRVSAS